MYREIEPLDLYGLVKQKQFLPPQAHYIKVKLALHHLQNMT